MKRTDGDRREDLAATTAPARGLARVLGVWVIVVATASFGLRVADAVPRVLLGVPRGVTRASDVPHLERLSGRRMPVPSYYPETIAWPPAEARYHVGGSAAIWCRQRPAGGVALIVATAPSGLTGVADAVVPASVELQHEDVVLGSHPAVVSRVRDTEGTVWQQAQWQARGQIILVRYRGTLDELLKIAGSVHE
jgi:hypothetical protein